jgi:hypothetical protein
MQSNAYNSVARRFEPQLDPVPCEASPQFFTGPCETGPVDCRPLKAYLISRNRPLLTS